MARSYFFDLGPRNLDSAGQKPLITVMNIRLFKISWVCALINCQKSPLLAKNWLKLAIFWPDRIFSTRDPEIWIQRAKNLWLPWWTTLFLNYLEFAHSLNDWIRKKITFGKQIFRFFVETDEILKFSFVHFFREKMWQNSGWNRFIIKLIFFVLLRIIRWNIYIFCCFSGFSGKRLKLSKFSCLHFF